MNAPIDTLAFAQSFAAVDIRLARQIAVNRGDLAARRWSTSTIIAGASIAIGATMGAAVALILTWNGS